MAYFREYPPGKSVYYTSSPSYRPKRRNSDSGIGKLLPVESGILDLGIRNTPVGIRNPTNN